MDLFKPTVLRRVRLGTSLQMWSQLTGMNIMMYVTALTTRRKRRGVRATVLIDQVSGAISQLALKDSKFNKQIEIEGLHSARRLAKELFRNLREDDVGGGVAQGVTGTKKREILVVEDFYPYFRSTADAVSDWNLLAFST